MKMISRVLSLVLFVLVLAVVAVAAARGASVVPTADITPTLIATAWQYLPSIRGAAAGPTAVPTLPPPSITPYHTVTPSVTATIPPTETPEPGMLAAPVLFDIVNQSGSGSFTVAWSAVPDAQYYHLQQETNGEGWQLTYEGPLLSLDRTGLPPGQYCYRVRSLNAFTGSTWSASKCTAVQLSPTPTLTPSPTASPKPTDTPTPTPYSCTIEQIGRFATPGLVGHRMTYLRGSKLVVVTGGHFYGRGTCDGAIDECYCYPTGVCGGDSRYIYVYDVAAKTLHRAGDLNRITHDKVALPMDDYHVLLTGSDTQDDFIIQIDKDGQGGYTSTVMTREPLLDNITNGITIDQETALLVGHDGVRYHAFIFNMITGATRTVARFDPGLWLHGGEYRRPQRMENGSDRFLFPAAAHRRYYDQDGYVIIDIKTGAISSFKYPELQSCPGWSSYSTDCPPIFGMQVTPLSNSEILLTNGFVQWPETGDHFYPTDQAFVVNSSGEVLLDTKTIFTNGYRLAMRSRDGNVILVNGASGSYEWPDYVPGAEIFDANNRAFARVEEPGQVHELGNTLQLSPNSFLVSGGYSDWYYHEDVHFRYPESITSGGADTVELITCR